MSSNDSPSKKTPAVAAASISTASRRPTRAVGAHEPLLRLGTPTRDGSINVEIQSNPSTLAPSASSSTPSTYPPSASTAAQSQPLQPQHPTSTASPTPGLDPEKPWKHPSELEYICRDDWPQDTVITYLMQNVFTVPPRDTSRPSKQFIEIKTCDGSLVPLPKGYRTPLMFVAKFQWESLRLVLTSQNPEGEWDEFKFDIIHLSRLCSHLLRDARKAAATEPPAGAVMRTAKGDRIGIMDRTWRCPMFDRALTRFYRRWMICREWSVKLFFQEFGEEEYETDVLKHDWPRWVLKGHKGFLLSKDEVDSGIMAVQFTAGLENKDGKWIWDNDKFVQARSIALIPSSSAYTSSSTTTNGSATTMSISAFNPSSYTNPSNNNDNDNLDPYEQARSSPGSASVEADGESLVASLQSLTTTTMVYPTTISVKQEAVEAAQALLKSQAASHESTNMNTNASENGATTTAVEGTVATSGTPPAQVNVSPGEEGSGTTVVAAPTTAATVPTPPPKENGTVLHVVPEPVIIQHTPTLLEPLESQQPALTATHAPTVKPTTGPTPVVVAVTPVPGASTSPAPQSDGHGPHHHPADLRPKSVSVAEPMIVHPDHTGAPAGPPVVVGVKRTREEAEEGEEEVGARSGLAVNSGSSQGVGSGSGEVNGNGVGSSSGVAGESGGDGNGSGEGTKDEERAVKKTRLDGSGVVNMMSAITPTTTPEPTTAITATTIVAPVTSTATLTTVPITTSTTAEPVATTPTTTTVPTTTAVPTTNASTTTPAPGATAMPAPSAMSRASSASASSVRGTPASAVAGGVAGARTSKTPTPATSVTVLTTNAGMNAANANTSIPATNVATMSTNVVNAGAATTATAMKPSNPRALHLSATQQLAIKPPRREGRLLEREKEKEKEDVVMGESMNVVGSSGGGGVGNVASPGMSLSVGGGARRGGVNGIEKEKERKKRVDGGHTPSVVGTPKSVHKLHANTNLNVNVRQLAAELSAVLSVQLDDAVRRMVEGVREVLGARSGVVLDAAAANTTSTNVNGSTSTSTPAHPNKRLLDVDVSQVLQALLGLLEGNTRILKTVDGTRGEVGAGIGELRKEVGEVRERLGRLGEIASREKEKEGERDKMDIDGDEGNKENEKEKEKEKGKEKEKEKVEREEREEREKEREERLGHIESQLGRATGQISAVEVSVGDVRARLESLFEAVVEAQKQAQGSRGVDVDEEKERDKLKEAKDKEKEEKQKEKEEKEAKEREEEKAKTARLVEEMTQLKAMVEGVVEKVERVVGVAKEVEGVRGVVGDVERVVGRVEGALGRVEEGVKGLAVAGVSAGVTNGSAGVVTQSTGAAFDDVEMDVEREKTVEGGEDGDGGDDLEDEIPGLVSVRRQSSGGRKRLESDLTLVEEHGFVRPAPPPASAVSTATSDTLHETLPPTSSAPHETPNLHGMASQDTTRSGPHPSLVRKAMDIMRNMADLLEFTDERQQYYPPQRQLGATSASTSLAMVSTNGKGKGKARQIDPYLGDDESRGLVLPALLDEMRMVREELRAGERRGREEFEMLRVLHSAEMESLKRAVVAREEERRAELRRLVDERVDELVREREKERERERERGRERERERERERDEERGRERERDKERRKRERSEGDKESEHDELKRMLVESQAKIARLERERERERSSSIASSANFEQRDGPVSSGPSQQAQAQSQSQSQQPQKPTNGNGYGREREREREQIPPPSVSSSRSNWGASGYNSYNGNGSASAGPFRRGSRFGDEGMNVDVPVNGRGSGSVNGSGSGRERESTTPTPLPVKSQRKMMALSRTFVE